MNKKNLNILLAAMLFFSISLISAQEKIDRTQKFQTDPAKSYSLYIPSNYDKNVPNKLMLGLHPWNVNRWNSATWRDKLTDMAEMNNLILLCPDGGKDGQIDDPIDTAFTSALLDSIQIWYNINTDKIFVMGFSWGGKTTYTYGLRRAEIFAGFIPIGAAINGINDFKQFLPNANDKPFYMIHGANDSPNSRFYPARDALIQNNAIVGDSLLAGVGHTVDFSGSTNMFDIAFDFVDNQNDITTQNKNPEVSKNALTLFPNPQLFGDPVTISTTQLGEINIVINNIQGKHILSKSFHQSTTIDFLERGIYFIRQTEASGHIQQKLVIK